MLKINNCIEPHAALLNRPHDGQLLYKIMSVENLLRSIDRGYLHFNRVDSYQDFPSADKNDGLQLPMDRPGNDSSKFEKNPAYSFADYNDKFRARTYACCFSLENSDYIWDKYGGGTLRGKVCIVFSFSLLRVTLNDLFHTGLNFDEYKNVFTINYGIIDYVDWNTHQTNIEHLQNPIKYIYQKDHETFHEEKEFRISLSPSHQNSVSSLSFPMDIGLAFDFRAAITKGTIQQILHLSNSDVGFLKDELEKRNIQACGKLYA